MSLNYSTARISLSEINQSETIATLTMAEKTHTVCLYPQEKGPGVILLLNQDNYTITDSIERESSSNAEKGFLSLIIWGGTVANCAESALSRFVLDKYDQLKRMVYFPARTKGGAMLRPKYCEGDRMGAAEFPNVEEMIVPYFTITSFNFPEGQIARWIAPNLKRITLLTNQNEFEASHWDSLVLPNAVRYQYPFITDISVAYADPYDVAMTIYPVLSFHSVLRCPEECRRLLLAAVAKGQPPNCHIGKCSHLVVSYILNYLRVPDWDCTKANS